MDEILWCYHSNETSSGVLSHGTICFLAIYKMKFGSFYFVPYGSDRDLKQTSSFSLTCVHFSVTRPTLLKTGTFRTDIKGVQKAKSG